MRVLTLHEPLIVGSGIAGLSTALALAPHPVTVLTLAMPGYSSSTKLAQGGIAAAVSPEDSVKAHIQDTLRAGDGLCEQDAVTRIISAGPAAIDFLQQQEVAFDVDEKGNFQLGREGAHSTHRILHADGDSTGARIVQQLAERAEVAPNVRLRPGVKVQRILVHDGVAVGVLARVSSEDVVIESPHIIVATGGLGGLYRYTTNPLTSCGQGIALALRAGATIRDLEMVQFHPTAIANAEDPMSLISEALRGAGAELCTDRCERFIDPLASRDKVARAIWDQLGNGHRVFVDARNVPNVIERFPTVARLCAEAGINPARHPIQVHPAAHYSMGGILVDEYGASTVPGLFAVGECASTGLHGANRLASNSLLEAVVCAREVAEYLRENPGGQASTPRQVLAELGKRAAREVSECSRVPSHLREVMEQYAGIIRTAEGLAALQSELADYLHHDGALVAWHLATSALSREESRGGHMRADFPLPLPTAHHTLTSLRTQEAAECSSPISSSNP